MVARSLYDPYSVTFADSFTRVMGSHQAKFGGEVRLIRMSTDRLGGTTYSFANITNFLANVPSTVQYAGDLSSPSPFNNGAKTGERHPQQEYYIAYGQDEWRLGKATFSYGLRYEYYTPLQDRDNLQVKFNADTGVIDPNTTPPFKSEKNNFEPRVALTYGAGNTVFRGGFGVFVGPGQTEDQIQPIESYFLSFGRVDLEHPVPCRHPCPCRSLHEQPRRRRPAWWRRRARRSPSSAAAISASDPGAA